MKGTLLIFVCVFAIALGEEIEEIEIELNENGCPLNYTIFKAVVHSTYCNLFYTCLNGELVEQRCPGELVFNCKEQVCDWPLQVDCEGKGISELIVESEEEEEEIVNPGGNSDPALAPEICAKEDSDGILVAHENCNQFYVCEARRPFTLDCPHGLLYNSYKGICDWPTDVECGDRVIPVVTTTESVLRKR